MKTTLKLLAAAPFLLPAGLSAQQAATTPAKPDSAALLASLPEAVRATVSAAAGEGLLEEVKVTEKNASKIYRVEIDQKDGRDLDLTVAADGKLLKTIEEITLSTAPEALRTALQQLAAAEGTAGTAAKIEDLEKVTEGESVTWRAELDRREQPDLKVKLDAAGKILEKKNDRD